MNRLRVNIHISFWEITQDALIHEQLKAIISFCVIVCLFAYTCGRAVLSRSQSLCTTGESGVNARAELRRSTWPEAGLR